MDTRTKPGVPIGETKMAKYYITNKENIAQAIEDAKNGKNKTVNMNFSFAELVKYNQELVKDCKNLGELKGNIRVAINLPRKSTAVRVGKLQGIKQKYNIPKECDSASKILEYLQKNNLIGSETKL